MPSTSKKQHNFMAAVANNPAFAKKAGVPQSVGKDFTEADKGKKFGSGSSQTRPDRQSVNKPKTDHGQMALFKKGGEMKESKAMVKKEVSFMKAKGAPKSMVKHEEAEMKGMKKGGMKKMASGGITTAKMGKVTAGGKKPHGEHTVQKKGHTKGMMPKMSGSKPLGMKTGGAAKKYC
jgi:hypothetical protein